MKVRVQFTIDSDRKRRATERARESGLSFAEYAAKLIKKDLKPTPVSHPDPIWPVMGIADAGRDHHK